MESIQSKALLLNISLSFGGWEGEGEGPEMIYCKVDLSSDISSSTWQWIFEETWHVYWDFLVTSLLRLLQQLRSSSHVNFTRICHAEEHTCCPHFLVSSPVMLMSTIVRLHFVFISGKAWYWICYCERHLDGVHMPQAGWNVCPWVTTGFYEIGLYLVSAQHRLQGLKVFITAWLQITIRCFWKYKTE